MNIIIYNILIWKDKSSTSNEAHFQIENEPYSGTKHDHNNKYFIIILLETPQFIYINPLSAKTDD